jgi:membrane associated rhomboid family serine protease
MESGPAMGIYDRDYYRQSSQQTGVHVRIPYSMVNRLIIINVVVFLIDVFTEGSLTSLFAMRVGTLFEPLTWWQTLTMGFLHSRRDLLHIVFNMLVLWFFGREVERLYGRTEFLRLYLLMVVFASFCWALFGKYVLHFSDEVRAVGASGAVAGVCVLFVLHYPRVKVLLFFVLPVPAWVAALIWVVYDSVGTIRPDADKIAHSAHLAGMAFAFFYRRFQWNFGKLIPGTFSLRLFKPRHRLRVHDPEADNRYDKMDAQADELLEKISREGVDSLTASERRTLEGYSRRMQQKRR